MDDPAKGKQMFINIWYLPTVFLLCCLAVLLFVPNLMARTDSSFNPGAVSEVMKGVCTEANAAWWGFHEMDSTHALQAAISSKAKKIIVPNMGKPWVVEPIILESDKEIIFEKGVIVLAKPGKFHGSRDSLFSAINKKNIIIRGYGAELIMRKQDYAQAPYKKAEWRHCLSFEGCRNIKVFGLRLANSGGDGIYIGRGIGKASSSSTDQVHIKDVICDNNYRQGISIVSASKLLIENSIFQNTSGTSPQAGIDFEPDKPDEILTDCIVRNCISRDNAGVGISMLLQRFNKDSRPVSITIEGCRAFGNKRGAFVITGKESEKLAGPLRGSINFKNCDLDGHIRQNNVEMLDIQFESGKARLGKNK